MIMMIIFIYLLVYVHFDSILFISYNKWIIVMTPIEAKN